MKKLILLFGAGFLFLTAFSQSKVVEFLKAGKSDANALVRAYLNPYALALGDGLNNGWYNSAKTHKLFGLDLSVSVSAIQIPKEATTFDLNTLGLTKLILEDPLKHFAPTAAGTDVEGPRLLVRENGKTIASFNTPAGVGLDIVPVPMAQIGFGLLPHTDLIVRFVPEMQYDNSGDEMKIGFWGLGVKHNFKEWIPVIKALPFDASVFGSYSQVAAQNELSLDPNDFSDGNVKVTFGTETNQMLKFNTKTSKFGLILSKKIGILTVYGGIGQSKSETTINLLGKYVVETTTKEGDTSTVTKDNLEDPIDVTFESKNLCVDAGLRLKLAFFSLFGSINKAEYTSYNAGLSLGFR
jgi:hypothetical protein